MCGRHFRHGVNWEEYHAQLNLIRPDEIPEISAAYNIAPTQLAPIIRLRDGSDELELTFARWDLVPRWWRKPLSEKKFSTFNAKSEDVAEKPTFRAAFKDRPCLLPMSGYYEWTGKKSSKQPYAISMRNRRWFCVAGLWDRAYIDDAPLDSFTILTKAASDDMAELHHRMPVIPNQTAAVDWIRSSPKERHIIIAAANADQLYFWKVNPAVGNVRNQGETLIEEISDN